MIEMVIGEVKSVTYTDIEVFAHDVIIPKSRLWIASHLDAGFASKLGGVVQSVAGSLTLETTINAGDLVNMGFVLEPGDRVLMLTSDRQNYYLMERVVKLGT